MMKNNGDGSVIHRASLPERKGRLAYTITRNPRPEVQKFMQKLGPTVPLLYVGNPSDVVTQSGSGSQRFLLHYTAGDAIRAVIAREGMDGLPVGANVIIELRGGADYSPLDERNFLATLDALKEHKCQIWLWTTPSMMLPNDSWKNGLQNQLYVRADEFFTK